ncbi:hypothetical protein MPER_13139 [Moniliophthora perniciosa FA553]|nr:hypothetical protein MPER_13139 [Moniliophthora perniciosa FA553]
MNAPKGHFSLKVFKSPPYAVYCAAIFFIYLGYFTLPWYISTTAQSLGFSDSLIFYLVSFFSAASCIGRLVGGVVADWMGSMNTQIPCMTVAALTAFFWPFANTQASLVVIAVLYGLSSGVYIALEVTPIVVMPGDPGDIGRRIGLTYISAAIGSLLSLLYQRDG